MKAKVRKYYKRFALALSAILLLISMAMGMGTSIAWFNDTSNNLNNIIHFGEFGLRVSHRLIDGSYEEVEAQTKLFNEEALYEPGYIQIVYLKIENTGTVDFNFKTTMRILDYTVPTNVYDNDFLLHEHLKFGLLYADTEDELRTLLSDRANAKSAAVLDLTDYTGTDMPLSAGTEKYAALIVRMPEEEGNDANYKGSVVPRVELGIIVSASQQN